MNVFNSYKFGAGRYIQEEQVLEYAGTEILRYGKKPYILTGQKSWDAVKDRFVPSLSDLEWVVYHYSGFPSHQSARQIGEKMREAHCDVIVGLGGGVICDLAKMAAFEEKLPVVLIPTSSATCAAFSPLSVAYTDEGVCLGQIPFEKEVDAVLVDELMLSQQPKRLVAAGILDAMAKMIEISNGKVGLTLDEDRIDKYIAFEMAKMSYEILERDGKQAYLDVEDRKLTKAVKNIIFTTIALTGIISAMMRGRGQTALAHKLYNSMRTYFYRDTREYLHGEIVATGLLMQLKYNHNTEMLPDLKAYMKWMKMPMSLNELGLTYSEENMKLLVNELEKTPFIEKKEDAGEELYHALTEIFHNEGEGK